MVPSPAMSRAWIAALVLSVVAGCREAEPPAAPAEVPAAATASHDVTGAYFAMTDLPAEFAELDHLSLATIDENAAPAPLNGFLRPKELSAKDYTLVSPKLDGRNLTFTTIAVDGVHYEFTGAFEVLGKFAENPPNYETPVLTGTLTKLRDGRSVASTPVKFRYEAGG